METEPSPDECAWTYSASASDRYYRFYIFVNAHEPEDDDTDDDVDDDIDDDLTMTLVLKALVAVVFD